MNDKKITSLFELNQMVKSHLEEGFPELLWIKAETSDVRINQNGHCYLEFIEKDGTGKNSIIAKVRAAIWANIFGMLRTYFEAETGQPFGSGLKVMVRVSVEFHEVYGLSLNVHDIDPAYTLGDQALNRAAILRQLEEDGVLELNKELELPTPTNRIAIISSPTAAGYEDFCNQLHNNTDGFIFYTKLFPAIMQGDRAEDSIVSALEKVYNNIDKFDVVILIRGGGATSELSCFDSYLLAASIAQFPLPVITGIGHERDQTVLDIVAHTRAKTPTAVAEFLISCMKKVATDLREVKTSITDITRNRILLDIDHLTQAESTFFYLSKNWHKDQQNLLKSVQVFLNKEIQGHIKESDTSFTNLEYKLTRESQQLIRYETSWLSNYIKNLRKETNNQLSNIKRYSIRKEQLRKVSIDMLADGIEKLNTFDKYIELISPQNILKKGYTLTMLNGRIVKESTNLKAGDLITTHFVDGEVTSEVK